MQDVMNCRGPNGVLNCEPMRSISGPKADHRVWLREGSMHVPLITAIIGKEVVDHAIKTRPVGAVVSVCCLCARDCNMRIRISFDRSVARSLVSSRKRDLHERAMIGPGREVTRLPCFVCRVRHNGIPVFKTRAPFVVESGEATVLLLQPAAKFRERMWIPVEVDSVAVRSERAFVTDEVVIHVVTRLVARRGADDVAEILQNSRIVE